MSVLLALPTVPNASSALLAVIGVAGLVYLLYRTLVQGKQLYGVESKREAGWAAARQEVLGLAAARGWPVDPDPSGHDWPADLAATRQDRRECLLAVAGPDFKASTWSARERLPGAAAGVQSRVWLLRLRAPDVRHDLAVRRASGPEAMALLPAQFRQAVCVNESPGGVFAAGDPAGLTLLDPLLDQIVASGSWVITTPGTVTVLATLDPDASGFEWRLGLARRVAQALATP